MLLNFYFSGRMKIRNSWMLLSQLFFRCVTMDTFSLNIYKKLRKKHISHCSLSFTVSPHCLFVGFVSGLDCSPNLWNQGFKFFCLDSFGSQLKPPFLGIKTYTIKFVSEELFSGSFSVAAAWKYWMVGSSVCSDIWTVCVDRLFNFLCHSLFIC